MTDKAATKKTSAPRKKSGHAKSASRAEPSTREVATRLSRRSVEQRAQALTARLRNEPIGPGETIALALRDAGDVAAAVLAVLDAGGTPILQRNKAPDAVVIADASAARRLGSNVSVIRIDQIDANEQKPAAPIAPPPLVHPAGTQPVVFMIAGGACTRRTATTLASMLGSDQPACVLDAVDPALGAPCDDLPHLARRLIENAPQLCVDDRVRLVGLGDTGALAYELAHQIEQSGRSVDLLTVVDGWLPQSDYERFRWDPRSLATAITNVGPWLVHDLRGTSPREVAARVGTGLAAAFRTVSSRIRGFEAPAAPTHADDPRHSMIRSLARAVTAWEPGPLTVPMNLIRAEAHPLLSSQAPDLGWGEIALTRVVPSAIPGAPHRLLESPSLPALAQTLRRHLHRLDLDDGQEAVDLQTMALEHAA